MVKLYYFSISTVLADSIKLYWKQTQSMYRQSALFLFKFKAFISPHIITLSEDLHQIVIYVSKVHLSCNIRRGRLILNFSKFWFWFFFNLNFGRLTYNQHWPENIQIIVEQKMGWKMHRQDQKTSNEKHLWKWLNKSSWHRDTKQSPKAACAKT